jgi:ribonucleoside-diphosphate reductase alpha chain
MTQKKKILITDEGRMDFGRHGWDDELFTDRMTKKNPISREQAEEISRFLKNTIGNLEINTITPVMIDEIFKMKLMDLGLPEIKPIQLEKSLFIDDGPVLSANARTVLERRYLKKDESGNIIELPAQMFRRVASHIAAAEKTYQKKRNIKKIEARFYKMMTEFKFLPNSPTLMNAGRKLGQLAACFVLPVEDSMEEIFETLKNAAIIHKSGGGTGFSFSRLRPKNSTVGTTGGIASGPVSFMKIFNTATEQVKQGGTRRGANMAILRVDHPDIMEFIYCKQKNSDLNNFNISVGLTERFMEAAVQGEEYMLRDPRSGEDAGYLNAAEVYDALVNQAWQNGDPGIIFLDRINRDNPTPALGEIESTNPCGEQPLLPMEACNLGSINLARFVSEEEGVPAIDYDELGDTVATAVRFLDNTIDCSKYPLPEIDQMVKGNRKIGLGVMGFADLLYQLEIPYDSEEALETAETVMRFVQETAQAASRKLARRRGPFENYEQSFFKDNNGNAIRNSTTTTIAPTGTLSLIAGCSSGIEPLFALSFARQVMDDDRLVEVNPYFEAVTRKRGIYSRELMDEIANTGGIQHMPQIPEDIRRVFVTAHDVAPEWHIRMQAAFQKYTDNAVSKTVNLPKEATRDDVRRIYDLAYELNCKGVTIYRDGSKENQVLSFTGKHDDQAAGLSGVKDRPETLEGFTTKIRTGLGQLYVTVTEYNQKPFEVFATIGKSGRSTTAKTEAIGRLVSLALRAGVDVIKIVEQLKGIGGEHPVFQDGGLVLSIPDAIARVLEKRYLKDSKQAVKGNGNSLSGVACPECGQTVTFEEGCKTCHSCGFNQCG